MVNGGLVVFTKQSAFNIMQNSERLLIIMGIVEYFFMRYVWMVNEGHKHKLYADKIDNA